MTEKRLKGAAALTGMDGSLTEPIFDLKEMRNKKRVFQDRSQAGHALAGMLRNYRKTETIVLAIPAGGVPVAKVIAEELDLPLDIAAVSKITLPWNTETGYGAVSFNGVVELNQELLSQIALGPQEVREGIQQTLQKVKRRMKELRGEKPFPELSDKTVILVDDGLASGFTLQVAVEALRKEGAGRIILAVPTGHEGAVRRLGSFVTAIYCPNLRSGWSFAVADAYAHWYDLTEREILQILKGKEGTTLL